MAVPSQESFVVAGLGPALVLLGARGLVLRRESSAWSRGWFAVDRAEMAKQVHISEVWPTPALIRAARGLLGIGQEELARQTGRARKTVIAIESHTDETMDSRREAVIKDLAGYLKRQGVEFLPPDGKKGAAVRFGDREREAEVVEKLRKDIERRKLERQRKAELKQQKGEPKKKRAKAATTKR